MVEDYMQGVESYCRQIIHDIKTPLSIVYSVMGELDRNAAIGPEARESFEIMKQSWLRIFKLVMDAEDYQKLSHGMKLPHYVNRDIVAVVRNVTESTRTLAARKSIGLDFKCRPREWVTALDKDIIERILLNLLSNAVKFTDYNGHITVALVQDSDAIVIAVEDDGQGISADAVEKVLEAHYFEESDANRHGSGMGLYIVKGLVGLLSGEIAVHRLAVGTKIEVRLPAFRCDKNMDNRSKVEDFYSDNMIQIELSGIG